MRAVEMYEILAFELRKLGLPPWNLGYSLMLELLQNPPFDDETKELLEVFALTREWPPLSERQRFLACISLDACLVYLTMAGLERDPDEHILATFVTELSEFFRNGTELDAWREYRLMPEHWLRELDERRVMESYRARMEREAAWCYDI